MIGQIPAEVVTPGFSVLAFFGTVLCTAVTTAVTTTWRVAKSMDRRDAKLLAAMTAHELMDVQRFADVQNNITDSTDVVRREFGETAGAIRQKVYETELWGRDNFLRTSEFRDFCDATERSRSEMMQKLDSLIAR